MRSILALIILLSSIAAAQTPTKLWEFDTQDASFGQSAAGDIDGDGRLELVFGCYRNDGHIYALNAEDGSLLWKVDATAPGGQGCNDVAPAIFDTDGDGTLEVIVPSSCNPITYCFDGATGNIRWSAPTRGSDSPPSVADIDNDGVLEILHGEFGGWVRCLDARNGDLEWELAVDTHSWIQTAPTLLDADGDGGMDFVVATWNRTEGDTNTIRCYRCSDRALLWSHPLRDVVYHGTAVADLNADDIPELVIGDYNGDINVLRASDGQWLWGVNTPGHYVGSPITAGDVDGDGSCELFAVVWYRVYGINSSGSIISEYIIDQRQTAFRGVVLSDVNGDSRLDPVFGTSDGKLIALRDTSSEELWKIDLAAEYGDSRYELDHAPIIADFDGDGGLDVFIVGGHAEYPDIQNNFGRAYAYSIGRGEGPPWLMFQQNLHRSSSLFPARTVGISDLPSASTPELEIYPHPVRNIMHILHNSEGPTRIYDLYGREVLRVSSIESAGSINLSALPSGMYILRIDNELQPETIPFVKR
ncbi:VCBS repeat-containing protein [bacterium]|nr:VCBS repeat-containing protein [bacterium]